MPDLSTVGGPALSATSDIPSVPAASPPPVAADPSPAPSPTPAAAPVPAEAPAPAPNPTEVPKVEDDKAKAPDPKEGDEGKPNGINKRFSELTTEKKEALDRATKAEETAKKMGDDLQAAIKKLDEVGQQREAERLQAEAAADKKPDRTAFDDPADYDKALGEWGIREGKRQASADLQKQQAEEKEKTEKEASERTEKEQREASEKAWNDTVTSYNDRVAKAKETMPDFDEVATSEAVTITFPMRDAIITSDMGPQIAYHLGKNPEEASRIAALTPFQQVKEMGRLEERLSRQRGNVSKTPDPITPSGPREAAGAKDTNQMSGDEYYEHRMAQQTAKR